MCRPPSFILFSPMACSLPSNHISAPVRNGDRLAIVTRSKWCLELMTKSKSSYVRSRAYSQEKTSKRPNGHMRPSTLCAWPLENCQGTSNTKNAKHLANSHWSLSSLAVNAHRNFNPAFAKKPVLTLLQERWVPSIWKVDELLCWQDLMDCRDHHPVLGWSSSCHLGNLSALEKDNIFFPLELVAKVFFLQ